jgi:hypothetical protein
MFKHPTLFAAAFLCGSCSKQGDGQPESLVGATNLPSAEVLSRETLYITRGANDWGGDRLAYELRPDGSLTVTHTYMQSGTPKEEVRARSAFRIQPEVAARFRRLMWRVRPDSFEGQGLEKNEVRPAGCKRRGPHDFGDVGVAFISEGDAKTTKDDRIALFELPQPDSCTTRAAKHARVTVWQALRLLPSSKAVEAFERAS